MRTSSPTTSGPGCSARASPSCRIGALHRASSRAALTGSRWSASGARSAEVLEADVVLLATGATPRVLPAARPDGERILSWRDVYDLTGLPEHLVVVGSGVTGAEFASGYSELGVPVTLVSSRDRVLPGEDPDAAEVLRAGLHLARRHPGQAGPRAARFGGSATASSSSCEDGRTVRRFARADVRRVGAEHCRSRPGARRRRSRRAGLHPGRPGLANRRSRRSTPRATAPACCCSPRSPAMQGRIAMWHALGEAVSPLRLKTVAANVFTHPEIATVGLGYAAIASGELAARTVTLPLRTNARAKMQGTDDGFVKLYCPHDDWHHRRCGRGRAQRVGADLPAHDGGPAWSDRQRMSRRQSGSTRRCQDLSPRPPAG